MCAPTVVKPTPGPCVTLATVFDTTLFGMGYHRKGKPVESEFLLFLSLPKRWLVTAGTLMNLLLTIDSLGTW